MRWPPSFQSTEPKIDKATKSNKVMFNNSAFRTRLTLLVGLLTSGLAVSTALTPSAQGKERAVEKPSTVKSPAAAPAPPPSISTDLRSGREETTIRRRWGIDNLRVRETSSGWLVRFSYRLVDTKKAAQLYDKKTTPYLIDERSGRALQIPIMEKVGQLRQTTSYPENGREYWMVFSNNGHFVKPGSRIDIVIGRFRVEGLIVE
jgi:hypothetical protein